MLSPASDRIVLDEHGCGSVDVTGVVVGKRSIAFELEGFEVIAPMSVAVLKRTDLLDEDGGSPSESSDTMVRLTRPRS